MHLRVWAIGDDPIEVVNSLGPGSFDWMAIGGRFTGSLVPVRPS
jgi:hypothetical protein